MALATMGVEIGDLLEDTLESMVRTMEMGKKKIKYPRENLQEWKKNEAQGNGQTSTMKNGCRMCKLPGKGNPSWIPVSDVQQNCKNKEKPCDLCSCKPGNPPTLVVDKDGCKKGAKCKDLETGKISNHRVGDTWDCWIKDKGCYAKCTCEDRGGVQWTSAKMGAGCNG